MQTNVNAGRLDYVVSMEVSARGRAHMYVWPVCLPDSEVLSLKLRAHSGQTLQVLRSSPRRETEAGMGTILGISSKLAAASSLGSQWPGASCSLISPSLGHGCFTFKWPLENSTLGMGLFQRIF